MAVASSSFQPSRIGFGSIRGAPLPAGRIEKSRCAARFVDRGADAAEDRAADHARPLAQRRRRDLARVERRTGARSSCGRSRRRRCGAPWRRAAARGRRPRARPAMSGWANRRSLIGTLRRRAPARSCGCGRRSAGSAVARPGGRPRRARRGFGSASSPLALTARAGDRVVGVLLGHRIVLGDRAEVRVRVAVAVDVLQHHVAAELLAVADLLDDAVVDGDDRRALRAKMSIERRSSADSITLAAFSPRLDALEQLRSARSSA